MLTNEELKAAIAAARVYPPGHGYAWYADDDKSKSPAEYFKAVGTNGC